MTDTEINIAIAEACGWKLPSGVVNYRIKPDGKTVFFNPIEDSDPLPSYTTDLNAMHEVEKVLDDEQWLDYVRCLQEDVLRCWQGKYRQWAALTHATAAQRAEAFLRTIGKWEE